MLLASHNQIRQIGSSLFAGSKSLTVLDLAHNLLDSAAFLQPLGSLESLNLSHNLLAHLALPPMANLESLNLAHNRLEALPALAVCFPELIALNIAGNLICSEHELLTALAETSYLTELDFRENPMHSEVFESGLQRVHNFDFLNGKVMSRAGAKYYEQVAAIHRDLAENSEFYGEDDEKDRQIRMSGFYDEELEFKMSGTRVARPTSPIRKKVRSEGRRNSWRSPPSTRTSTGATTSSWTTTAGSNSSANSTSRYAATTTSPPASTS